MSCEEIWREIPNYIGGKHGAAMRASMRSILRTANTVQQHWVGPAMWCGWRPMRRPLIHAQGIVIA